MSDKLLERCFRLGHDEKVNHRLSVVNPELIAGGHVGADNQPMVDMRLSELIRRRLVRLGKSQAGLADFAGVSRQAVTKWLKGGRIDDERLALVAQFLEISLDELLRVKLGDLGESSAAEKKGHYDAGVDDAVIAQYRALPSVARQHIAWMIRIAAGMTHQQIRNAEKD